MSTQVIKYLICLGVGVGIGFIISNVIQKNKNKEVKDIDYDFVESLYEKKRDKNIEEEVPTSVENDKQKTFVRASFEKNAYELAKRDYNLLNLKTPKKEEVKIEEEDEDEEEKPPDNRDEPYIISLRSYLNEFPEHDKATLYYYAIDDTLVTYTDEIVDDVEDIVGYKPFEVLEMQTEVWVRNERLSTDYEISRITNMSFEEMKYGITEESPKERYARTMRRRNKNE